MPEIGLYGADIVAIVGELVSTGMLEDAGNRLPLQATISPPDDSSPELIGILESHI